MMKSAFYQTLKSSLEHPQLGTVIARAVDLLDASEVRREHGPRGEGDHAIKVYNLHSFRREIGYYKPDALIGLDETVEALSTVSGFVRLGLIETTTGTIALWFDETNLIVGIMISKMVVD